MAMLAERKSKSKWVLNPRGSNAINEMQFGRKMLEKMGWQSGDGLGVNKQGTIEPLRVHYKNDVKGIGYKKNVDNEWLKVEDEYSRFLQDLSSDTSASGEKSVESLEKKSEGSKARLHYRKFTRNKDLSRYTEKDLSCILGYGKTSEVPEDETKEESGKFFDKGNMNTYFEQMTQKKFDRNSVSEPSETKSTDQCFSANEGKPEKFKSGKKKRKSEISIVIKESECDNVLMNSYDCEGVSGRSKRKKHSIENSATKENLEIEGDLRIAEEAVECCQANSEITDNNLDTNYIKAKKRKSHHLVESDSLVNEKIRQEVDEGFPMKSNRETSDENDWENKRKKKKLKLENVSQDLTEKSEKNVSKDMDSIITETSHELESSCKEKKGGKKKKSAEPLKNRTVDAIISISNGVNQNEKVKYRKKKSEEINETEAILNVQIKEKSDSLRMEKGSRRKEKSKRKKRKYNDSKENNVYESSEELSAASCHNSPDGRLGKTKLKKDKNRHNKNVLNKEEPEEIEESLANTSSRIAHNICDNLKNRNEETPNKAERKVRFDLFKNLNEDLIKDGPLGEGIHLNEKGKSSKVKKQKSDQDRKTENFDELESCEKETEMEQTESTNGTISDLERGKQSKSIKKLKSKINEEALFSEEATQRPRPNEEGKFKSRLKCENQSLEDETEEPLKNLAIGNLKIECDSSSNDSFKKKKNKLRSSEISGELKDLISEDKIEENELDFKMKKVEVENDSSSDGISKKKNRKLKKSNVSGEDAMKSQTLVKVEKEIMSSSSCSLSEPTVSGKKLKRKKYEETPSAITDSYYEDSEFKKKSKFKKPKANHAEDEVENNVELHNSAKIEVTSNGDKNSAKASEIKPSDRKAKLLALLQKTTKDDSDESDGEPDSNSVTNMSKSCFKGSNFEQIPGYRNTNLT